MPNQPINFQEVTQHPFFVDKTGLLGHFYSSTVAKFKVELLLTQPGSFASTHLAMMALFWGSPQSKAIFKSLQVGKNARAMKDQGNYFVVSLDFTDFGFNPAKPGSAILFLRNKIRDLYLQFEAMIMESDEGSKRFKESHTRFLKGSAPFDDYYLGQEFLDLLTCLRKATKQKVIVLIDGVDRLYEYEPSPSARESMDQFYEGWLGYDDGVIERVVMMAHSDPFVRGVNNMCYRSMWYDGDYLSSWFGFTDNDIAELLKKYKLSFSLMNNLLSYAGGYSTSEGEDIYHPALVMRMLQDELKKQSVEIPGGYPLWFDCLEKREAVCSFLRQAFLAKTISVADFFSILAKENKDKHQISKDTHGRLSMDFSIVQTDYRRVLAYLINQGLLSIKFSDNPSGLERVIVPNRVSYDFIREVVFGPEFNPEGDGYVSCPKFHGKAELEAFIALMGSMSFFKFTPSESKPAPVYSCNDI